ncbi:MAG: peptide deformylase [Planctomycetes bacterium]|nr:peptide deformylase [Planctomycetota bacterium]
MAPPALSLRLYPEPVLFATCAPVAAVTDEVRRNVERMFEIMNEFRGVGLAAPQVGWTARVFIANCEERDEDGRERPEGRLVFINPTVVSTSGEETTSEGCLSFPGLYLQVKRPALARLRALGLDGKQFEKESAGLLGRCMLHECDHLDGVLFIDRAPRAEVDKIRREIRDLKKKYKESLAARKSGGGRRAGTGA